MFQVPRLSWKWWKGLRLCKHAMDMVHLQLLMI